jgi:hypothetical protein
MSRPAAIHPLRTCRLELLIRFRSIVEVVFKDPSSGLEPRCSSSDAGVMSDDDPPCALAVPYLEALGSSQWYVLLEFLYLAKPSICYCEACDSAGDKAMT